MKYRSLTILAATAATLSGCASRQMETATGDIESMRWTATISPIAGAMVMDGTITRDTMVMTDTRLMSDTTMMRKDTMMMKDSTMMRKHDMANMKPGMMGHSLSGSAVVAPASGSETSATVMISGAMSGETYPWHVHVGTCGNDQGIVGPPASYTPITADASGKGQVSVTLPYSTPTTGSYMINVHHMGKIVSCGQLSTSAAR